jgi:hypothetical protein
MLRGRFGSGIERLTVVTGWTTLILSLTTCTIPGYLLLLGEWGEVHTWVVLVTIAATLAVLLPIANRTARTAVGAQGTLRDEAGVPVSVS